MKQHIGVSAGKNDLTQRQNYAGKNISQFAELNRFFDFFRRLQGIEPMSKWQQYCVLPWSCTISIRRSSSRRIEQVPMDFTLEVCLWLSVSCLWAHFFSLKHGKTSLSCCKHFLSSQWKASVFSLSVLGIFAFLLIFRNRFVNIFLINKLT